MEILPVDLPRHIMKTPDGEQIALTHATSHQYSAGGPFSLVDHESGSLQYNDGRWLGFEENDFEVVVDLEESRKISYLGVGFLQNQAVWIFLPSEVAFYVSEDGLDFMPAGETETIALVPDSSVKIRIVDVEPVVPEARFIKIVARNIRTCPPWHAGAGGKAWIFVDEIRIK